MAAVIYGVTDKGFVRKPLSAILEGLNNKFIGAFGQTFDVSPASPDGQVIGIMADEIDQCWQQAEYSFNAYRPGAMKGVGLDNICELTSARRDVNTHTRVTVLCSGSDGTTVPAGSLVTDGSMKFKLMTDVVLPGDVTVEAVIPGEYFVAPGKITKIDPDSERPGWTGVINLDEGQTGTLYEDDPQLRAKRDRTTAAGSATTTEAIYAALSSLNLSYIRIRDNDTGSAIGTQPAGTIYVVVEGGTKNDIARRIYNAKTGGVPTFGSESITITDSKGYPHEVRFSRPSGVDIYISGTFKRRPGSNISSNDTAQLLQEAAIGYINTLQPGDPVVWSYLFTPLMAAVRGVEVDSLFIGFNANPTTVSTLEIDIDRRASTTAAMVSFKDMTNG